jgi:hypothetical protein
MFEVYCWPSYNYHKTATRVLNRERDCLSLLKLVIKSIKKHD